MNRPTQSVARLPVWSSIFRAQLRRTLGARRRFGWFLLALVVAQIVALAAGGMVFGLHISTGEVASTMTATLGDVRLGNLEDF